MPQDVGEGRGVGVAHIYDSRLERSLEPSCQIYFYSFASN